MVKAGLFPIFRIMAVAAIKAKLAFMHIILAVAGLTFGRSLAIFCLWFVATIAFCGYMFIFKDKTRFVMLEERLVKYHNLRVSPLMIGVAFVTLLFLEAPVIPLMAADILCRFLVTIETQAGLRILIETFMAFFTLLLILGVAFDHLARHHHAFYRFRHDTLRQK